jgi:hypothetical protein
VQLFALHVLDVYPDFDGFAGILLAGQVTAHGDLAVGDTLWVPTDAGRVRSTVSGFPLIRWTDDRIGWRGVAVEGVPAGAVVVGGTATNEGPATER